MRVLSFIILLIAIVIGTYYQIKSSEFLKEEFRRRGFFRKLEIHPTSFNNEEYKDKRGITYRNLSLAFFFSGVLIFIIINSLIS